MKSKPIFLVLFIAILMSSACKNRALEPDCFPGLSTELQDFRTETGLFPRQLVDPYLRREQYQKQTDKWDILTKMQEPQFEWEADNNEESYRLLWFIAKDNVVSIRITEKNTTKTISVKHAKRVGGLNKFEVVIDVARNLTESEWNELLGNIKNLCLWGSEAKESSITEIKQAWMIEGVKKGRFHAILRHTPDKNFQEVRDQFLRLSAISTQTIEK